MALLSRRALIHRGWRNELKPKERKYAVDMGKNLKD